MTKENEPLLDLDAITGRFHVTVDEYAEPADWDRALARFLLASSAEKSSISASTPAERASLGTSALETAEHSEQVFVANRLHRPRDVVLIEEPPVLFNAGRASWPRSSVVAEPSFHG